MRVLPEGWTADLPVEAVTVSSFCLVRDRNREPGRGAPHLPYRGAGVIPRAGDHSGDGRGGDAPPRVL